MTLEKKFVENKITEAQLFLTRDCNLRCGYCNLVKSEDNSLNELDIDGWKRAYDNMEDIGIKTVKLMGGEPTVREWLPELLEYISKGTIKTAILSNSLFDNQTMERLVTAGLWGYFASVDGLGDIDIKTVGEDAAKKSHKGYLMLNRLKEKGIPLLAANVVINRQNIYEIPELVQRLSDESFYINLCTVQHTNQQKEFSKPLADSYKFNEEDREELEKLAVELIRMKHSGVRLSVPESYIKDMHVFAINSNWQCDDFYQLRVDSDGGLMLCNEWRTELADKYNITSLTPEKYEEFLHDWKEIRKKTACDGCYWSCFLQAKDNIENRKPEFHYLIDN